MLISEEADTTAYDSPPTEIPVGFGRPLDDPALPGMTAAATVVFSEAVALVGDALGVVFDEIVCEAEYAKTTKDLDLGSWTLAKDTVAGVTIHWLGKIDGKNIVEMRVRWRKGDTLEPDWDVGMGWSDRDPGPAHDHHEDRHSAAAVLRGDDHGGIHGARAHPHGAARRQRHPGRRGSALRDCHLRGHPPPSAQGLRPDLTGEPQADGRLAWAMTIFRCIGNWRLISNRTCGTDAGSRVVVERSTSSRNRSRPRLADSDPSVVSMITRPSGASTMVTRSRPLYNRVEFGPIRWTFCRRNGSSEGLPGHRGRPQTHCQGEGRGFESRLPLHCVAGQEVVFLDGVADPQKRAFGRPLPDYSRFSSERALEASGLEPPWPASRGPGALGIGRP